MKLKISEINMNCQAKNRQWENFIFDYLRDEDIIIFTEIVAKKYKLPLVEQLKDFMLYCSERNLNDKGNQIIIAIKNDKNIRLLEPQLEFSTSLQNVPDFLQLRVVINDEEECYIMGVRILADDNYDKRLRCFEYWNNHLQTLQNSNVIVLGDFNHGRMLDDYTGYAHKNYNYHVIQKELANNFEILTPAQKSSYGLHLEYSPTSEQYRLEYECGNKYRIADDHLIISKNLRKNVIFTDYDWSFVDKNSEKYNKPTKYGGYIKQIKQLGVCDIKNGVPDHAILRARINL